MKIPSALRAIRNWRQRAKAVRYRAAALAKLCCVSPRTLRRFFHDDLPTSLRGWLKRMRIHDAKTEIVAGAQIKNAASHARYKHAAHFTRQFKWTVGIPPTVWRASRPAA